MTRPAATPGDLGYEAFGAASGLALVAGALSVLLPFLVFVTGTLAALGLAGWAARRRAIRASAAAVAPAGRGLALGILGAAAALYLVPPGPLAPYRGLVLGLGVAALWWAERSGAGPASGGSRRP